MVRGCTGFGGALVLAPCYALLIAPRDAAELVILVHMLTCLQGFRGRFSSVRWRGIVPLACTAVLFTAIFGKLLDGVDASANRRVIGCAILVLSCFQLSGWRWRHGGGKSAILLTGAFSGLFTAIAGAGGPPAVVYFSGEEGNSGALRTNLLAYFVLLYVSAALILAWEGRSSQHGFLASLALAPLFYGGFVCGERVYARLHGRRFERLVAAVLAVSGMLLVFRG
jgi:uncharacterized membrane protein YfcA